MFNQERLQLISRYNERIAKKRFKKLGFKVETMDLQGRRKRPDLLVSEVSGPLLLCEVKTKFSGGYLSDRGAHVSTEDRRLIDTGPFSWPIDLEPMSNDLADACAKFRELAVDLPDSANLPLVVLFFFDEFADNFMFYPHRMDDYPEVSAIAVIEDSPEILAKCDTMSLEELKVAAQAGSMKGFPPPSKWLRLVVNVAASHPLPQHFLDLCLVDERGEI